MFSYVAFLWMLCEESFGVVMSVKVSSVGVKMHLIFIVQYMEEIYCYLSPPVYKRCSCVGY